MPSSFPRSSRTRALRWVSLSLASAGLLGCGTVVDPWHRSAQSDLARPEAKALQRPKVFPLAIESAAVAERLPEPHVTYPTPAFQAARETFTSQSELQEILKKLAEPKEQQGLGKVTLLPIGVSQLGVPIEALLFSRLTDLTPAAVVNSGRPTVLLIGQQHGDEPASAEALLVLAQELSVAGPLQSLLTRINVLIVPRANPDGAALEQPLTVSGIDVNRDHLLLRTPEARALAQLMLDYQPLVVLDSHEYAVQPQLYVEKFGAVQRTDAQLQYGTPLNGSELVTKAAEEWFRRPLIDGLTALALTAEWHHTTSSVMDDKSVSMGGVHPETARNVAALRNSVSLMVETRGVGLGRRHLKRRVQTQLSLMGSTLRAAADHAVALAKLRRHVDLAVQSQACRGKLVLDAKLSPGSHTLQMLHPATGLDLPVPVKWHSALTLSDVKTRARPCGYWLSADQTDAVGRLRALGVNVERLSAPASMQGDPLPGKAGGRGSASRFKAPVASYYVTLAQPLGNLAAAVLEPESPEGYLVNNVLTGADHASRVNARPKGKRIAVP